MCHMAGYISVGQKPALQAPQPQCGKGPTSPQPRMSTCPPSAAASLIQGSGGWRVNAPHRLGGLGRMPTHYDPRSGLLVRNLERGGSFVSPALVPPPDAEDAPLCRPVALPPCAAHCCSSPSPAPPMAEPRGAEGVDWGLGLSGGRPRPRVCITHSSLCFTHLAYMAAWKVSRAAPWRAGGESCPTWPPEHAAVGKICHVYHASCGSKHTACLISHPGS